MNGDGDRFMTGIVLGYVAATVVIGYRFATAPSGADVWYGYASVLAAIAVGVAVVAVVGYGIDGSTE